MNIYDKALNTKFNTDTTDQHIGTQYQPSYDKPITNNSAHITLNAMTDVQSLDKAYSRDTGLYIRNDTMLVAGTKDFPQDHWDELKIPFNLTPESLRYRNADNAFKYNPPITSVVGYALGVAVILEMQHYHDDKGFRTTTYGSPTKSIIAPANIDNTRFINIGDPIYS
jgi:hypothetical protein